METQGGSERSAVKNLSKQNTSADAPIVDGNGFKLPSVNPPKGGGAIRGIGEKFATNPVTGSGSNKRGQTTFIWSAVYPVCLG